MEAFGPARSRTHGCDVAQLIDKRARQEYRYDHPLQRPGSQWTAQMKSNLVSDILQGNPIPSLVFAEDMTSGKRILWSVDGKQRSQTVAEFAGNQFKIARTVRKAVISYDEYQRNGDPDKGHANDYIFDSNGDSVVVRKEYDISGKKFKDLPFDLRDRFMRYEFQITELLNCTPESIAYDLGRYNDGRPMTSPQKGFVDVGTEKGERIRQIEKCGLFGGSGFTANDKRKSNTTRVITEALVLAFHPDSWNRSPSGIAKAVRDKVKDEEMDAIEDTAERINAVLTEETSELFTPRDTYLYMALFERFKKTGRTDSDFESFLEAFNRGLRTKEISGESFDSIQANKSTKDKKLVLAKLAILDALMNEFFNDGIVKEETRTESVPEEPIMTLSQYESLETDDVQEETVENNIGQVEIAQRSLFPDEDDGKLPFETSDEGTDDSPHEDARSGPDDEFGMNIEDFMMPEDIADMRARGIVV